MTDEEQITLLDSQRSIYIFPNPSSAPPSPGGSMVSSIPSDYTGTLSGSSRPGSREHSISLSSRNSRSPRGRRTRGGSSAAGIHSHWRAIGTSPSGRTTSESGTDVEVEVWDWMADSDGVGDENATWELEAEVERVGRWGIPVHAIHQPWPAQSTPPASSSTSRPLTVTIPYRFHPLHSDDTGRPVHEPGRSRTQSNTSAVSSSLASTFASFRLSPIQSPQPRVQIPLLSFIASLFSLDLDDPALRLLTNSNSTSESVLFPGHNTLLDSDSEQDEPSSSSSSGQNLNTEAEDEETSHPEPHGFLRLLVISDESRLSIRALRDGLVVSCTTVLPSGISPFSLPGFDSVLGVCRLVGDACFKGGKALRELRT